MEIAEARFGPAGKEVVQTLFLLGHTSVSELEKAFESKNNDHVNGNADDPDHITNGEDAQRASAIISEAHLHSVLHDLLTAGYIEPVVRSMFLSPTDVYNNLEKDVLQGYGNRTTGTKQVGEVKVKVRKLLHDMRFDRAWNGKTTKRLVNGQHTNGTNGINGINGTNGTNKRKRPLNGNSSGDTQSFEDDGMRLDVGALTAKSIIYLMLIQIEAFFDHTHQLREVYSCLPKRSISRIRQRTYWRDRVVGLWSSSSTIGE